jgi:hypothetical protein
MTNPEIRQLYKKFNAKYFGNRLPHYRVVLVNRITNLGEDGHLNRKQRLIRIQKGLSRNETISTLLHEMVHAATTEVHGKPFIRELRRLRGAGATLGYFELDLLEREITPLTKEAFRYYALIRLNHSRGAIKFPNFVRDFALNNIEFIDLPETAAAFKRRFWWAPKAFQEAKREWRRGEIREVTLAMAAHGACASGRFAAAITHTLGRRLLARNPRKQSELRKRLGSPRVTLNGK